MSFVTLPAVGSLGFGGTAQLWLRAGRLRRMSFDTLAPAYRALEFLVAGNLLQRCRTAFMDQARNARAVLLLGEGPGRYLVELVRVNPSARVTCLDSSARMLEVAQQRLRACHLPERQIEFIVAEVAEWPVRGPFDLVATHFFLDCFHADQLAELARKIGAATAPAAAWILSDFRVPEQGWQRMRARLVLAAAYSFFRLATGLPAKRLTPPAPFVEAVGFRLVERRILHHGLLYADLWRKTFSA